MDTVINIPAVEIREIGKVKETAYGIVKAEGFFSCIYGQLVEFESGTNGMILGFNRNEVLIIVLGDYHGIKVGDSITAKDELLSIPVGNGFLGRVVDCLAHPIDGKGRIVADEYYSVFRRAPGIIDRKPINEQIITGIKILDLLIPIGKGQRELVVGDRQTGKTSVALDIILSQKDTDTICIYCFIGSAYVNFRKIVNKLSSAGMLPSLIGVCVPASASSAEQFISPYTAASLGEYFMRQGKDVIVIFDDLTKHAWAYRQISLLLNRFPGREAYPGDIFFIHSQLMERAGNLKEELGNGSMTFFPIVETLQGDITGYIPSNLISMTDGQVFMNTSLFHEGFKPAIDIGLSVSRLGAKVQLPMLKDLSKGLRLSYLQYREMLRLMKLRTGFSTDIQERIRQGKILEEFFMQDNYCPFSVGQEVVFFYVLKKKILAALPYEAVTMFRKEFLGFLQENYPEILKKIENVNVLNEELKASFDNAIVDYFRKSRKRK
ncbi:MAG: F0F1 ATP synthase subunit alpha [Candidatus Omnitrophota bacterium]|nr:MAG: F0F1 ATP synthase subunit alpha [Candidatus Omnitrophota bacterium]